MAEEPRGCGWGVGLAVFVVLGVGFTFLLTLPLAMSSDGCSQYDQRFKCSSTGQWLVPVLPWLGIGAGLVAAIVGIALARKWNRAPAIGFGSAVGCYVVTVAVGLSFAAAGPLPPDPNKVLAAYDELTKRPDFETMLTRDHQLALDIQATLGPAPWNAPTEQPPGDCDPPLGIVGYDAQQASLSNGADGTVTADQLAAVNTLVTARGFTRSKTPIPDGTRYQDGYGAAVTVSTKPRLFVDVDTGCFLTSEAKQRGVPSLGP